MKVLLFCAGKEHSLEVVELEQEVKEEMPTSEQESEDQLDSPVLDSSVLELCQPKMKIFHGRTAPGLRIRSGPTFMVRSILFFCRCYI